MKKQIALNILSNYAGRIVGMAIGFFLVPFLVSKLGNDTFGLVVLFESLMLMVEVVSTSVRIALSRYATYSLSKGEEDGFCVYLSTGRVIFMVLGALIFLLGLALAPAIPLIFRIPEIHQEACKTFFVLMVSSFAITMPNVVFWSGLYAKQRFDLINLANSSGVVLRGAAIFILFSVLPKTHVTLVTYGLIHLAMTWMQNSVIYLAFRRVLPAIRIRLRRFDRTKVREILAFSFYTFSGHLGSITHDNILSWMINRFWGVSANAFYGIGMKFSGLLEKVFLEPTWTLTPAFTDLVARGEKEKLKHFLFAYTKSMASLVIPVCLILSVYAHAIIRAWVGEAYQESATIMIVTLIGQFVYLPVAAAHNLPNAVGRVKWPAFVSVLFSALSVILCYVFAIPMGMGLKGMALGATLSSMGYSVLYLVPYALRISGFSVAEYWLDSFIGPCAWSAVFWGLVLLAVHRLEHGEHIALSTIGWFVLALPGYLYGAYRLVLNDRDRRYVHEFIAYLRSKTAKVISPP